MYDIIFIISNVLYIYQDFHFINLFLHVDEHEVIWHEEISDLK